MRARESIRGSSVSDIEIDIWRTLPTQLNWIWEAYSEFNLFKNRFTGLPL